MHCWLHLELERTRTQLDTNVLNCPGPVAVEQPLMFVSVVNGLRAIVAERDSNNAASNEVLPVLPRHLVSLRRTDFKKLLKQHNARLRALIDSTRKHQVGQEFVKLKRLYQSDADVRESVDQSSDVDTTFEEGWELLGSQYPRLCQFCGDFATAFRNTATVESDFSVMGLEKASYWRSLTDFSLEGVLHAKQYEPLQRLCRAL
jgi:hypothetical protein